MKYPYRKKRAVKRKPIRKAQRKLKPNYRKATTQGAVKKIVRQVLSRTIEKKLQTYDWTLTPLSLQNTTGNLGNNYIVLNPSNSSGNSFSISRGTGSGQMIGDKIRTKNALLKYVITQQPYNATTNPLNGKPLFFRIYFYKYKKAPQNDPQVTNICGNGVNANFFELGASQDIGFVGNLTDLNQIINTDSYTYLGHRTFKLGNQVQPNTTLGVGSPIYAQSNNDFKMAVFGKLNITKYMPKICSRDDSGVWQNDYVIMMCQYVYADGTTATNVSAPLQCQFHLEFSYTDA